MDTDALFMNIHISLAQLLAGVEKNDLMILAADAEGINAGTFSSEILHLGDNFVRNYSTNEPSTLMNSRQCLHCTTKQWKRVDKSV